MTFSFRLLALAALLLTLGACGSVDKSKEPPPCPRVSILNDAAKMMRFRPGQGRDITDVQLQAEVISYHGFCKYEPEKKQMTVVLQIGIDAQLGPAAAGRNADIAYFVAVPAFYPQPQAKQVMTVPLAFPENTNHVRYTDEELSVTIPLSDIKELGKYDVILGLQLTADEVDYNRRQAARR